MTSASLWTPFHGAGTPTGRLHVYEGSHLREVSIDEWHRAALCAAAGLRARGVSPGSRVGCVLSNTFDVCATIFGIWLAGGVVVSLPVLSRGLNPRAYATQLARLARHADIDLLLIEAQFASVLEELMEGTDAPPMHTFESLASTDALTPTPPGDDDVVFIQYSSGSTRDPKGCMLTARAIADQMEMLSEVLEIDPATDRGVSWLPLSHDMGLFGCLMLSWTRGMPLVLSSPQRFLRSPKTWLADCSAFQATITAGPNFALELVARAASAIRSLEPFPMRKWVIGGERIDWTTLDRTASALAPLGLDMRAFNPAYGLAEATLAVTMVRNGEHPSVTELAARAQNGGDPGSGPPGTKSTAAVSTGRPLPGAEIKIAAAPGEVGEIFVRSPSLAQGYVAEPALTAERFVDGGVRTGDLGFLDEAGALHVVGRIDDMISVAGRKVYARDLEHALDGEEGVRPGTSVLVDTVESGRHRLVVLAEPGKNVTDYASIAVRISGVARTLLGVRIDECFIVPGGTIPKTPSGKIQRHRCRELITAAELPVLAQLDG